jgi:DNA-binding response OmpR family regulator
MTEAVSDRTRVLVVDDERFFREAICDLLGGEGVPVVTAADAAEALEAATDPRVGVVVLDIQLPDRSGLEVLRTLRDRRPEVRVVMLSAHTDQEYVLEALRLGACDYLAKPLHEEEMRLSVRRALEAFELAAGFGALRGRIGALAGEVERLAGGATAEDPDALAARLAEAASRLLDAGKTSVLLRDADGDRLRVAAAVGRKERVEDLDPVPLGGGVAGQAVAQGRTIVVDDVTRDPRFGPAEPGRYDSGAFVVMPLGGGEAFGALCATDRRGGARFGEEDVALLRLLGLALGPWLDPGRAAARTPEPDKGVAPEPAATGGPGAGSDDADLARAVCDAMTREVEPERVLRAALGAVAERLGADPVAVYLLDPLDGNLRREAQWTGEGPGDRARLPRQGGVTGLAFEGGEALAAPGTEDPRFDAGVDTAEGGVAKPLWVLPLRFRGKTLGVCRAFPAHREAPSPRTAEVLGAALSAAVRNVLLYRSLVESIEEVAEVRREAAGGTEPGRGEV